ncbi:MAG: InlB B-repeat-containing protein, partial [Bacteroidaceae bacterium]|nr:InlB B-repeat-containing protein [Bacteroidaceae bacterium]
MSVLRNSVGESVAGETSATLTSGEDGNSYLCQLTFGQSDDAVVLYSDAVVWDEPEILHEHPICGANCGHNGEHENKQWTPISTKEEILGISEAGCYYLTVDIDIGTNTWTPVDGVVLDLNGKTLSGSGSYMIRLDSNVEFTVTDCRGTGSISHTYPYECHTVYTPNGTSGAAFNLYNGSIESNGYAYCDWYGNQFNQYGGSIASDYSMTVFVQDGAGEYNLFGGIVTNTNASTSAIAVCVRKGSTKLTMSGDVEVSGPIGILVTNPIILADALEKPSEPYTIYTANTSLALHYFVFTEGWDSHMSAADPTDYFAATTYSSGYIAAKTSAGELQLVEKPAHVCQWSYSIKADQTDIIVATCNGEGECTSTANKELAIIEPLHIEVNDGKNAAATLSATSIGGITELPDIVYYKYSQYPNIDESSATTTPFENVGGTYKAQITVGGVTAYTNYTVKRLDRDNIKSFTISDVTVNSFVITLDEADRSKTDFVCEFGSDKIEFTPDTNGRATITVPDVYAGSNNLWVYVYQKQTDIYKKSNTKDTTVSLKNPEYTVIFNANGGTCETASAETIDGKLATLPDATRVGYIFNGWFDAAEGENKITTETEFTTNKTVYAQWTAYAITQQPTVDNEYEVIVNPSANVAYTWHEITETPVTTENADVYEDEGYSSSYTAEWWSCHSTEGMGTPGYFSIDLNAGDVVEVELSRACTGTVRIQHYYYDGANVT